MRVVVMVMVMVMVVVVVIYLKLLLLKWQGLWGNRSFHLHGVLLISLGVLCDAATSNFEEKKFFRIEHVSLSSLIFSTCSSKTNIGSP